MSEFDFRAAVQAQPASAGAAATSAMPKRPVQALSPAAEEVASERLPSAYSPIVLAGAVRMIELALVALSLIHI